MRTVYKCDLCGRVFSTPEEAEEHENHGHLKPVKILKSQSNWAYNNQQSAKCPGKFNPNVIFVQLSDGEVGRYGLMDVKDNLSDFFDGE